MQDWILTKERVPDNIKDVLVIDCYGEMGIAWYNTHYWSTRPVLQGSYDMSEALEFIKSMYAKDDTK